MSNLFLSLKDVMNHDFKFKDFILEPLSKEHNLRDFEAWSSSKESLKGVFGPNNSWPMNVSSLDENSRDLEKHYKEHLNGVAYTFTILSLNKESCVGCFYIRPQAGKYEARIDYWFTDDFKHLGQEFHKWSEIFLKENGFSNFIYPFK